MFKENKRFDGRKTDEFRDLEVTFDVSNKAEGSARVKLGNTEVIAGVKLQVGTPYPDSPDAGNLMVTGDLLPIASPHFETGPPGFDNIEIPRLIDRAIRESGMIDFSKLVITAGEKVWTVMVDVYPINNDGNIIDAGTIAAVAALKVAKFPELDENGNINYKKLAGPLPINDEIMPLPVSVYKLGEHLFVDPTFEEEVASESRTNWGISKPSIGHRLNSAQKRDKATISSEEIIKMMEIAPKIRDSLDEKLKKFLKG
jgi:exosome complex component RRP42